MCTFLNRSTHRESNVLLCVAVDVVRPNSNDTIPGPHIGQGGLSGQASGRPSLTRRSVGDQNFGWSVRTPPLSDVGARVSTRLETTCPGFCPQCQSRWWSGDGETRVFPNNFPSAKSDASKFRALVAVNVVNVDMSRSQENWACS